MLSAWEPAALLFLALTGLCEWFSEGSSCGEQEGHQAQEDLPGATCFVLKNKSSRKLVDLSSSSNGQL